MGAGPRAGRGMELRLTGIAASPASGSVHSGGCADATPEAREPSMPAPQMTQGEACMCVCLRAPFSIGRSELTPVHGDSSRGRSPPCRGHPEHPREVPFGEGPSVTLRGSGAIPLCAAGWISSKPERGRGGFAEDMRGLPPLDAAPGHPQQTLLQTQPARLAG